VKPRRFSPLTTFHPERSRGSFTPTATLDRAQNEA